MWTLLRNLPSAWLILTGAMVLSVAGRNIMWLEAVGCWLGKVTPGEWVQAVSGIVGVALTVWAALWLEDRKRGQDRRDEIALLRDTLHILLNQLHACAETLPEDWSLAKKVSVTAEQYVGLRKQRETLAYARDGLRIRDYGLWSALNAVDAAFAREHEQLKREEGNITALNVHPNVYPICRSVIQEIAERLTAPVAAAVHAVDTANLHQ